jgi:hypothetical protein
MAAGFSLEYLLFGVILLVFYSVRDSELLRIGSGGNARPRILTYGLSTGAAVMALTIAADATDIDSFIHQARDPAIVKVLLCIQLGIWFYYVWLRRAGTPRLLWTVAVLPSPILVLCLSGLTVGLRGSGWWIPVVTFAVVVAWVYLIESLIAWSSRATGEDPAWGLNFATFSHLFIVFLLPVENVAAELRTLLQSVMAHD